MREGECRMFPIRHSPFWLLVGEILKIMRDSEIEQSVLRQLESLDLAGSREVCIFSQKGIVTLSGSINRASRLSVQRAARQAPGVVKIINKLTLKPPQHLPTYLPARLHQASR
jgi:hypothetical protein